MRILQSLRSGKFYRETIKIFQYPLPGDKQFPIPNSPSQTILIKCVIHIT